MTACYTQRPLTTPAPAPTTRIVATVTDSGTVAMSNAIGSGAVAVEGIVAAANGNAWDLLLVRVDHRDGRSILWNRERVSFPSYALADPTERTLDKRRSWLAAGVVVLGAFLAARAFSLIGGDEVPDDNPIPQEIIVPVGGRR